MTKLLGRNYKWWYFFVFSMTRITKFKLNIFGYRLGQIIEALGVILVWQANTLSKPTSEINNTMTYFVIGYLIVVITRTYISNSLSCSDSHR